MCELHLFWSLENDICVTLKVRAPSISTFFLCIWFRWLDCIARTRHMDYGEHIREPSFVFQHAGARVCVCLVVEK